MKISIKLFFQYVAIFFNFSSTLSHFHPLQVENCDSNSRLVVDEDENGKFRLERVNNTEVIHICAQSGNHGNIYDIATIMYDYTPSHL